MPVGYAVTPTPLQEMTTALERLTGLIGFTPSNAIQIDTGPLSEWDNEGLKAALQDNPMPKGNTFIDLASKLHFIATENHSTVYVRHGGYLLLYRVAPKVWLLNLDIGVMITDERLAQYREIILNIPTDCEVIPLSITAFRLGAVQRADLRQYVHLVHRQGVECVFRHLDKYFLSGYDSQESPPLYFLCQLPGPVETVDEARFALMPESVRIATAAGKRVERQGDIFAVETDITTQDLVKSGAKKTVQYYENLANGENSLYGTAHTAEYVVKLPSGQMLASGKLLHRPHIRGESRSPDHADCELSEKWWLVVPNTVPKENAANRTTQNW